MGTAAGVGIQVRYAKGTSEVIQLGDDDDIVSFDNAAAIAALLPNNAPKGFACAVVQRGAGQVTFAAQSGGSLVNRQGQFALAGQYAVGTVLVIENPDGASAQWVLAGDTA